MLLRKNQPRHGLSLLEVLAALTIFLLSLIAVGQLMSLATDRALDVQWQSRATLLAESKLAEFNAGILTLTGTSSGSFDEDPSWSWNADIQADSTMTSLYRVVLTVSRPGRDGKPIELTLSQYIFDPSMRGSLASPPPATTDSTSSSSSSSSSSSGTTSSSSGGTTP